MAEIFVEILSVLGGATALIGVCDLMNYGDKDGCKSWRTFTFKIVGGLIVCAIGFYLDKNFSG